ncbi:hypothetical protein L210DRAFT_3652128 [Boletus edulis BED1]|uniref:Uncharacterized protein n=1 Tax=Boletus edulis BED1 TaxID=1328754 RepID=A0AAD4BGC6_BOLED|nr:hypothetical protein L210DRAFT_3652128 [Boletus edulis BED1]
MSDVEHISDNDNVLIRDDLSDDELVDDGDHDVPYNATDVPIRLSADDAPRQRDIEAAVYDHGMDVNRATHVAMFFDAPISTTSFSTLRRLCERNDVNGALRLLSGRHRLELDPDLIIDNSLPRIIPSVGPHFLDFVIYMVILELRFKLKISESRIAYTIK